MRGGVGYKTIEVDVNGKEIRELNIVVPNKGSDVYLTLNKELQKLARKELDRQEGRSSSYWIQIQDLLKLL